MLRGVQLELLLVLVAVAVLLGLGVGAMVREIQTQRRREREAEQATLAGRVKSRLRDGVAEATKQTVKASRKGAWWMFRRRMRRKPDGEKNS